MFRKLLCWGGWYRWVWKFNPEKGLDLDGPISSDAKCMYCGKDYAKK